MHALIGYYIMSLVAVLAATAYLLPTVIGWVRHTHGLAVVVIVNVAFGWTLAGWWIALLLAVRKPPVTSIQVINQIQQPR